MSRGLSKGAMSQWEIRSLVSGKPVAYPNGSKAVGATDGDDEEKGLYGAFELRSVREASNEQEEVDGDLTAVSWEVCAGYRSDVSVMATTSIGASGTR